MSLRTQLYLFGFCSLIFSLQCIFLGLGQSAFEIVMSGFIVFIMIFALPLIVFTLLQAVSANRFYRSLLNRLQVAIASIILFFGLGSLVSILGLNRPIDSFLLQTLMTPDLGDRLGAASSLGLIIAGCACIVIGLMYYCVDRVVKRYLRFGENSRTQWVTFSSVCILAVAFHFLGTRFLSFQMPKGRSIVEAVLWWRSEPPLNQTLERIMLRSVGLYAINRKRYEALQNQLDDTTQPFLSSLINPEIKNNRKTIRPPIFIIVSDSLRRNLLNTEIMPNLSKMEGTDFTNHYSVSNCTHFGFFGLFTGLFPNLYRSFNAEPQIAPVLSLAKQAGYKLYYVTSEDVTWFQIDNYMGPQYYDKTELNYTKNEYEYAQRDKKSVESFKKLVEAEDFNVEKPIFVVVYIMSNHYPYGYLGDHKQPYQPFLHPSAADTNSNLNSPEKIEAIRNAYKNSGVYVDEQIRDMANALRSKGVFDESVFIVAGDHGEEVFEHGHLGHVTDLNSYTLNPVFFMKPPQAKRHHTRVDPTSHVDVLPTLFGLMTGESGRVLREKNGFLGRDLLNEPILGDRKLFASETSPDKPKKFVIIDKGVIRLLPSASSYYSKSNLGQAQQDSDDFLKFLRRAE
jgi:membrane-anchored protein YejM (alkaline phosphatase superfamily)